MTIFYDVVGFIIIVAGGYAFFNTFDFLAHENFLGAIFSFLSAVILFVGGINLLKTSIAAKLEIMKERKEK
ncbi:MAG: hypothetical protein DRP32_01280 [Thermotogae bacterium]|uniref:hypothetical protein n=1 Tax=Kosmotoga sp. TaxID=1955248 RepID=UPI000F2D2E0A|nr:hypothetical protein [Kosmotoga sp.]MBO8165875.1 hypothetical protein [Kosmotoga sp.]MCD6159614.1 hypothetical protein [Kosmotoga sp.]RKX50883.1 MAG: hypothetical protein DRP32_01280 [Thermotogota bacterium]